MLKQLTINFLFIFSFYVNGQISNDTINKTVESTLNPRKKIEKIFDLVSNRTLTNAELEYLKSKMLGIGASSTIKSDLGFAYFQFAFLCTEQKKINEAIRYNFEALKIAESTEDSLLIVLINYKLGVAYNTLKNTAYAKKYFYNSIAISKLIKNNKELVENYNLMGTIFKDDGVLDSALFYNKKALEIRLQIGDKKGLASSYNNIALVYKRQKNYDLALTYLQKALALRIQLNDKKGEAGASINIGNVFMLQHKPKEALEYIYKGTRKARSVKNANFYQNGIEALAICYYEMKDYKKSADYLLKYKKVDDSIGGEEMDKQMSELAAQYETGKKDAELKLKEEQIKSKTAQNAKQKVLTMASIIALLMALIAVFFIYRSFKMNKRNAIQLASKNKLIEEKNKEITDSINYARIIQHSLLASKPMLDKNLGDYFILYKPKDIVSGDFYWAAETSDGFTLACVDCTGHGVPGAFMSLIGKENLDKALSKTTSPQKILSDLNKGVKNSLNQNEASASRDGMDAAVVRLEQKTNSTRLTYSGANRPLWIIRADGNQVEEIKATKCAIGGFTDNNQVFKEHVIELKTGDSFFIFTDGFVDQFGGNNQKKITTKFFKELLLNNRDGKISSLSTVLENFFSGWKGQNEQIDDVLVIGVKV
ncbi:MAG: tetratricopeptide repeat protein [Bacteroidetes bacterium]|nr:tetratricopeptide repeat protein [Bacteroidota bacterium]